VDDPTEPERRLVTGPALSLPARRALAAAATATQTAIALARHALTPATLGVMAPAATVGWAGAGDRGAAVLLGAAWAVAVAVATSAGLRRRAHRRPASPAPRSPAAAAFEAPAGGAGQSVGHRSPIAALGSAVRRLSPVVADARSAPTDEGPPAGSPVEGADRRAGWAVLAGLGLLAVAPALAAVPVVWSVAAPVVTARRRRAATDARLHDQLPDVVDLLTLTAGAGLPVGAALDALGDRPGGPLGAALACAGAHVRHGGSTAEALALLSAAGPNVRPLVDALAQHDRYGSPLLPALERVAIEARARRRRRAEEAARRLPVTLLLPLVLTTFPAFVLLTVIPLLAGSLGSLSLSPT
jgi:tight adherence protein C